MTTNARSPLFRQGALFLVIGGLSALADAGVFWVLATIGVIPWVASGISFMSAFAINYRGNRDLVFRSRKAKGALVRYCVLVVVNLGLSAAGVQFGVWLGAPPILAKVATMVLVAVVNFVAMRSWVFRHRAADGAGSRTGRDG